MLEKICRRGFLSAGAIAFGSLAFPSLASGMSPEELYNTVHGSDEKKCKTGSDHVDLAERLIGEIRKLEEKGERPDYRKHIRGKAEEHLLKTDPDNSVKAMGSKTEAHLLVEVVQF